MQYKAICFDIDGTLYPASFLNRVGSRIAVFHPFVSIAYRKLRLEIRRIQDLGNKDFDKLSFRDKEAEVFGKQKGLSRVQAREYLDKRYYAYLKEEYSKLQAYPETRDTFVKIKNAGLKIGVFSDWPLFDKLKRIGVEDLCDVVSNSDIGGYLKPSVHAFEHMISELNIKPSEILYVGDSYEKDVQGPAKIGMKAVLINPECQNQSDYPAAVKVCKSWEEFDSYIDSVLEEK